MLLEHHRDRARFAGQADRLQLGEEQVLLLAVVERVRIQTDEGDAVREGVEVEHAGPGLVRQDLPEDVRDLEDVAVLVPQDPRRGFGPATSVVPGHARPAMRYTGSKRAEKCLRTGACSTKRNPPISPRRAYTAAMTSTR